ncbi:MAG: PEGA domain-containing protein [Deltaproteobacteria bacterium]|nr:PEGA domain-containing protein [Deltaproteobacteria bacterium]
MKLIGLALGFMAAGGNTQAGLESALKNGLTQFARGEWKGAVKTLRALAPRLTDPPKRGVAYLHLGLAQLELKQFRLAEDAFALAVTADPLIDVDPVEHPPRGVALFRATRDRFDALLTVLVDGPPARVFIDGVDRGQSPLSVKVRIGRHRVRAASADGKHEAPEQEVILRVGQAASVSLTLRPRPGLSTQETSVGLVKSTPLTIDPAIPPTALSPEVPAAKIRVWPPRPRKTRPWAWALAGTALASLGTGAVLYFGATTPPANSRETFNADVTRYNTRLAWGGGLLIGGAAIGLGAVALFALHREGSQTVVSFSVPQSTEGPLAGVAVAIHR